MVRSDAARNRERVLTAAREAFARDGLGVPIDDIARSAGVGAGTVYRHFPTKESLYEAVLMDRVQSLIHLAHSCSGGEGLFTFFEGFATTGTANRALAEAMARSGVDVNARLGRLSEQLKDAVSDLLRQAQRSGTARADITPDDLQTLLAAIHLAGASDEPRTARLLGVLAEGLRRH